MGSASEFSRASLSASSKLIALISIMNTPKEKAAIAEFQCSHRTNQAHIVRIVRMRVLTPLQAFSFIDVSLARLDVLLLPTVTSYCHTAAGSPSAYNIWEVARAGWYITAGYHRNVH